MNTTMRHTPGPWSVVCSDEITPPSSRPLATHKHLIFVPVHGGDEVSRDVIAEIDYLNSAYKNDPTERANAQLISAAPELLAALESLIDAASWTPTDNWRIGPMDSSKGGKMDMARKAIAKAKGQNHE